MPQRANKGKGLALEYYIHCARIIRADSHRSDYEDFEPLDFNELYFDSSPTFQRYISSPLTWSMRKPNKKVEGNSSLKRRWTPNELHGFSTQKAVFFNYVSNLASVQPV